jgi:hypothetical protein
LWGFSLSRKKRHLGATKNSEDPDKAYPASVASLFASLRQFWPALSDDAPQGSKLSADSFKENPPAKFRAAVDYVYQNFKKLARHDNEKNFNYSGAAQRFQKIERGGDDVELGYEDIIIAAEWVGLTVPQLLFFCYLISIERRAETAGKDSKIALRNGISDFRTLLDSLDNIVERSAGKHILYGIVPESEHKFYAKEELLLEIVEGVNGAKRLIKSTK